MNRIAWPRQMGMSLGSGTAVLVAILIGGCGEDPLLGSWNSTMEVYAGRRNRLEVKQGDDQLLGAATIYFLALNNDQCRAVYDLEAQGEDRHYDIDLLCQRWCCGIDPCSSDCTGQSLSFAMACDLNRRGYELDCQPSGVWEADQVFFKFWRDE